MKKHFDYGKGPCVKRLVMANIIALDGEIFSATNHCDCPQLVCPRSTMLSGEGYEYCRNICKQKAHAEINALELAGEKAKGATMYIVGHHYACNNCLEKIKIAGIEHVIFLDKQK